MSSYFFLISTGFVPRYLGRFRYGVRSDYLPSPAYNQIRVFRSIPPRMRWWGRDEIILDWLHNQIKSTTSILILTRSLWLSIIRAIGDDLHGTDGITGNRTWPWRAYLMLIIDAFLIEDGEVETFTEVLFSQLYCDVMWWIIIVLVVLLNNIYLRFFCYPYKLLVIQTRFFEVMMLADEGSVCDLEWEFVG